MACFCLLCALTCIYFAGRTDGEEVISSQMSYTLSDDKISATFGASPGFAKLTELKMIGGESVVENSTQVPGFCLLLLYSLRQC